MNELLRTVRDLIDEELYFIRPWKYCDECKDECEMFDVDESTRLSNCENCQSRDYQNLKDSFINSLIVYLADKLRDEETTVLEETEILKLLYQIYQDNSELITKTPDEKAEVKIEKVEPSKNVRLID